MVWRVELFYVLDFVHSASADLAREGPRKLSYCVVGICVKLDHEGLSKCEYCLIIRDVYNGSRDKRGRRSGVRCYHRSSIVKR